MFFINVLEGGTLFMLFNKKTVQFFEAQLLLIYGEIEANSFGNVFLIVLLVKEGDSSCS